jgi:hypothetical protein
MMLLKEPFKKWWEGLLKKKKYQHYKSMSKSKSGWKSQSKKWQKTKRLSWSNMSKRDKKQNSKRNGSLRSYKLSFVNLSSKSIKSCKSMTKDCFNFWREKLNSITELRNNSFTVPDYLWACWINKRKLRDIKK